MAGAEEPAAAELARGCLLVLARRGQALACAESLTAGLVCATLAETPGASAMLRGGVVAYTADAKQTMLHVPADLIARHGVYSAECAAAMARGAIAAFSADWGVSATGVAGPDADDGHRPGDVYVGVAGPAGVHTAHLRLSGGRNEVRAYATAGVLRLLLAELGGRQREHPSPT